MANDPDPHGQAALMLCESLILLLIERGLIGRDETTETVNGVIEVERERAVTSHRVVITVASINLLQSIAQSLSAASAPDRKT